MISASLFCIFAIESKKKEMTFTCSSSFGFADEPVGRLVFLGRSSWKSTYPISCFFNCEKNVFSTFIFDIIKNRHLFSEYSYCGITSGVETIGKK